MIFINFRSETWEMIINSGTCLAAYLIHFFIQCSAITLVTTQVFFHYSDILELFEDFLRNFLYRSNRFRILCTVATGLTTRVRELKML